MQVFGTYSRFGYLDSTFVKLKALLCFACVIRLFDLEKDGYDFKTPESRSLFYCET